MSRPEDRLEPVLHPWSLRFNDFSLEEDFKLFNDNEARPFNRIGIILSFVAWFATAVFLYISFRQYYFSIVTVLAVVLYPLFTINLFVLSSPRYEKYFQLVTAISNGAAGLTITYFGHLVLQSDILALSGVTIVVLFAFFILRLRFTVAVWTTLSYVAVYQVMLLTTPTRSEIGLLSFILWVVVSTCVVGGNILERANRETFYQNRLRQLAEAETRATGKFLSNMFDLVSIPVIVAGEDHLILETNPASQQLFGSRQRYLADLLAPSQNDHKPMYKAFLRRVPIYNYEIELLSKDASVISALVSVSFVESRGEYISITAVQDISARKKAEEAIAYLAYHDTLTGLPNRLLFTEKLERFVRANRPVAVMFIDLDQFKMINDTRGHSIGDQLLQQVAERLRRCVREQDIVSRTGGDEFTVILPVETKAEVIQVAKTILEEIRNPFFIGDGEFYIRTSIGMSFYPTDGDNVETILKHADIAMYRSKELGGNNYKLFTDSMRRTVGERVHLERLLHSALANDEFVLYYQPQVDLRTGNIFGVEALIRWVNPELGLIPPDQFIPIAEETGLIIPIGEWVLRTACGKAEKWNRNRRDPIHLSVNLSVKQFLATDFVATVDSILQETGLSPNLLELELTESIFMQHTESVAATMRKLKRLGVRLSIDDFGSGYSSLAYLKDFPSRQGLQRSRGPWRPGGARPGDYRQDAGPRTVDSVCTRSGRQSRWPNGGATVTAAAGSF